MTAAPMRLLAFLTCLFALLLTALPGVADARMRRVEPGALPALAAGEGLVLLAVDSSVDVHAVRVSRNGRQFGAGVMRNIAAGRSHALYVAPAGRYAFREVDLVQFWRTTLRDDPEFHFEVRPGVVTYPGDLVFRPRSLWLSDVDIANRALAALDWLEQQHPELAERHEFEYSGHYPDPFPTFYRARRGQRALPSAQWLPPPEPTRLALDPALLWKPDRIVSAALNPAGTLAVLEVREDDARWALDLVDIAARSRMTLIRSPQPFRAIDWSGDERLVLTITDGGAFGLVTAVDLRPGADGERTPRRLDVPRRGHVVDALQEDPDHILFASLAERGELMVHRLDVSGRTPLERFRFQLRTRLNHGVSDDLAWMTDGSGALRLGVVERDGRRMLVHGSDGRYAPVLDFGEDTGFQPVQLSADGSLLYGLSDSGREQRDVVVWSIAERRIVDTVFSRPGVDIVAPLFDAERRPIGASYYVGGRLINEYTVDERDRLARALREAFPDQNVVTAARSRDGRRALLWVESAERPPTLYHFDADRREAAAIDDAAPWLGDHAFAPTRLERFEAGDGTALEAFLTLPASSTPPALIVFPHGGPIGVADRLHFDREVQFLAALGHAVLRVNFRGSDGYGRAFREAGHRNYGRLIEDDIDAAITHVLARHALDAERICVVGASYGGYSGLVAAVRWPQRFRCVVSIAGVSDLPLFFTASDGARNARARARFEQVIGDPREDLDAMLANSPLYRHERIEVPVMLVHGSEDRRVDFEHARRLQRMLALAGRPPSGIELTGAAHRLERVEDTVRMWRGVAGFLEQHLAAPSP